MRTTPAAEAAPDERASVMLGGEEVRGGDARKRCSRGREVDSRNQSARTPRRTTGTIGCVWGSGQRVDEA